MMARDQAESPADEGRTRHIDIPLGQRVRRLREDQGLTQVQVCEALGISSNQWSRHESGKNRIPAARLWQFCQLVRADVTALFERLPHSVTADSTSPDLSEDNAALHHADDDKEADIRTIVAGARSLTPGSRRLLLEMIRLMREEAKN